MYSSHVEKEYFNESELYDKFVEICQPLRVRYLGSRGHFSEYRMQWLARIFPNMEVFDFGSQDSFALSLAQRDYDILFVGAKDVARIVKFSKVNAAALDHRVRFAIMDQTDPPRRARLLNAGFDDVFDVSRMVPDEAVMRIGAVWKRYKLAQEQHAHRTQRQIAIRSVTNGRELGPSEYLLLQALCERVNHPVSHHKLASLCGKQHESISLPHLKVLVSGLRKKMNSHCKIESISGYGYILREYN